MLRRMEFEELNNLKKEKGEIFKFKLREYSGRKPTDEENNMINSYGKFSGSGFDTSMTIWTLFIVLTIVSTLTFILILIINNEPLPSIDLNMLIDGFLEILPILIIFIIVKRKKNKTCKKFKQSLKNGDYEIIEIKPLGYIEYSHQNLHDDIIRHYEKIIFEIDNKICCEFKEVEGKYKRDISKSDINNIILLKFCVKDESNKKTTIKYEYRIFTY